MKVKDIMTSKVVTVQPGNSIVQVVKAILKHKIHSVPVVDDKNNVVGIITEKDLFVKEPACDYLPLWIDYYGIAKYQEAVTADQEVKKIRLIQANASDIMTTDCVTISADTDLQELIRVFREMNYKTLPVVDEKGKLSGIVSLVDVIRKVEWNK